MHSEATFILLFVVATSVAIASRRLHLPYTVALVLTGLLLGALDVLQAPALTQQLLFTLFLPGLLFEAAYHLQASDFRRNLAPILALAVPGVLAAILLTAAILTPFAARLELAQGFRWEHGLVLGALLAATDPIAVIGLFKSLGAPHRLGVLMEGESLLNDGTAVVLFTMIVAFAAGGSFSPSDAVIQFFVAVGGGALVGIAIGMAVSEVMRRIDDAMIEITLTTIAAYGSFVAAESFHFSGVIATVAAGMLCGNYAAIRGMSPSTRISVETFWGYVAFALNSIVFLLIGFEVQLSQLWASWLPIVAAYLAVTVGRSFVVGGVSAGLMATGRSIPASWSVVLGWGGLRGGISMVLALSLPPGFPHRDLLITMTFGVVILIILGHGLTMSPLLRRLGLTSASEARRGYEKARGELQTANRALVELQAMRHGRFTDPAILNGLETEYEGRAHEAQERMKALHLAHQDLQAEEAQRARRRLLHVEKEQVLTAHREGLLGAEAHEHLLADIDARLARLDEPPIPTEPEGGADPARDGA